MSALKFICIDPSTGTVCHILGDRADLERYVTYHERTRGNRPGVVRWQPGVIEVETAGEGGV